MTVDDLSRIADAQNVPLNAAYGFADRLKFAFELDEIRDLFRQLKRTQITLDGLIPKNVPQSAETSGISNPPLSTLKSIRKHAMALYTVLAELANCPEHNVHCANLRLECRDFSADNSENTADQINYNR